MVSYNPYITWQYNPLHTLNNQVFFSSPRRIMVWKRSYKRHKTPCASSSCNPTRHVLRPVAPGFFLGGELIFKTYWLFDGSEIRRSPVDMVNTLPETNIAMENPPFGWYLPGRWGFSWAMLVSGRVSHCLPGFSTIPGGCLGFLNHQQWRGSPNIQTCMNGLNLEVF